MLKRSFILFHPASLFLLLNEAGDPNHAVMLVGWDDSMGQGGCWILKNSSSAQWGEGGFMYIGYGKSRVGVCPTVMIGN
ncbi:MAG: C1 family peptidase [Candidatus Wallbacteria bacterium]|nr:C1 family peptidase [Candidatus Wallbacteria bacterium]